MRQKFSWWIAIWIAEVLLLGLLTIGYAVLLEPALNTARGVWATPYLERIPAYGFVLAGSYALACLWWLMWKTREPRTNMSWSQIPMLVWLGIFAGVGLGVFLLVWPFFNSAHDLLPSVLVGITLFTILTHCLIRLKRGGNLRGE